MKIASFPPNIRRPSPLDAARHINEEARLVLASLRCGPPNIARGELALGLRELRALVRGQLFSSSSSSSSEAGNNDNGHHGPQSPTRPAAASTTTTATAAATFTAALPPPPLQLHPLSSSAAIDSTAKNNQDGDDDNDNETKKDTTTTPPTSPIHHHLSPPTPHSVPPSSSSSPIEIMIPSYRGDGGTRLPPPMMPAPLDPGPYAAPFLAVIVDPRAAGPHTLAALRALHRLLERGSIVQATECTATTTNYYDDDNPDGKRSTSIHAEIRNIRGSGEKNMEGQQAVASSSGQERTTTNATTANSTAQIAHETKLEPIARGVLACRFEQTDAGADEAVEMAIADLLQLVVELDSAGARAVEAALLKQIYKSRKEREKKMRMMMMMQHDDDSNVVRSESLTKIEEGTTNPFHHKQRQNNDSAATGTTIQIQRLPSSIVMDAFHAVLVTRHTFVHDGDGHHSPALSFHFEQVLMRMIHFIFGGEDDQSALKNSNTHSWGKSMTTMHAGGARKVLAFLIDSISLRKSNTAGEKWSINTVLDESTTDDRRTLCLRLIQCCLRIGWGGVPQHATKEEDVNDPTRRSSNGLEEDEAIIHLIEDDLCLALITAGQAIFPQHDETSSFQKGSSPSPSGADILGSGQSPTSLELLSEVCATLSLLWTLPKVRIRLHAQFESVFSGFYQRALSLLRRRPLPEDGMAYQANLIFDMEVEVILESLVDLLCISSGSCKDAAGHLLSTVEELFYTYDCSMTESDVASGLLVELSRCCGGVVDEDGETYLPSTAQSKAATTGVLTPDSTDAEFKIVSPISITRYRPVPDHLKELCAEALLGYLRLLFYGVESLWSEMLTAVESDSSSLLRAAKNKKRLLRHAAQLFNEKPRNGLKYLAENGLLPNPPDPLSVASFLRNGLVVGLDKAAVGQYLGEVGKLNKDTDIATEQEWFHKELLGAFCSSFNFKGQTVLEGLRMFLSTFRLPGEAQMIDRILQAFSDSVACQCEESIRGSLKLFSPNEKRASDAAYLLSFSIIMLNTDLHNENIRANRKMNLADFVRNNRNYGKDISDNDLPCDYLEEIYRSVKEEQIRTVGEGAKGFMTIERWKDVMRSADRIKSRCTKSRLDAKAIKELILESSWQPILSAIFGLWGTGRRDVDHADVSAVSRVRIGIDLAYEVLTGSNKLGRIDIFQDCFTNTCSVSGLMGEYIQPMEERADTFIKSFGQQSAFSVAINVAEENGDLLGIDGWKSVWLMILELRDLKLVSGMTRLMKESDPDLLSTEARFVFNQKLTNRYDGNEERGQPRRGASLMSLVFGSSDSFDGGKKNPITEESIRSLHGKEDQLLWDHFASSDEEDECTSEPVTFSPVLRRRLSSIGVSFKNQLSHENATDIVRATVTGLERLEISHANSNSLRARVRRRLANLVDFHSLVLESRYLSDEGLSDELNSLVEIIRDSSKKTSSKVRGSNGARGVVPIISPASEALAEILICEIALKNRDRFSVIWDAILRAHYNSRLTCKHNLENDHVEVFHRPETINLTFGIEKCVTGILRLGVWSSSRNINSNEVLSMLKMIHPPCTSIWSPLEVNLDKHLAEGLWRIVTNVDGLSQLNDDGWDGILGLAEWCAARGGLPNVSGTSGGGLADDDPSLQAFRSLHLILHAVELENSLRVVQWPKLLASARNLVEAGERGNCPKLCIASLELLQVIIVRMESIHDDESSQPLLKLWLPVLQAMSDPAEKSRNVSVRQQAIALLTDSLLEKNSSSIPVDGLCEIMNTVCIPLVGKRVTDLLRIPYDVQSDLEETLNELELCISLLFKPFLHHIKALVSVKQEFIGIWISMLGIVTQLLGESAQNKVDSKAARGNVVTRVQLFNTTKELASEHLRNAVMVLAAMGVLLDGEGNPDEISSVTWAAIGSIGYCRPFLSEWKESACQL